MGLGETEQRSTARKHPWRRQLAIIVLACGLVVGYAHWHVSRLQNGDVAWSTPGIEGETAVAGGNLYTFSKIEDELTIVRISDGKELSRQGTFGVSTVFLGRSGWFATSSFEGEMLTFHSPDGTKQWERKLPGDVLSAPQAISKGQLVFRDCPDSTTCTLRSVDASGREKWSTKVAPEFRKVSEHESSDQDQVLRAGNNDLELVPSIAAVYRDGRLTQLDDDGSPQGVSIDAEDSTAIGDTLVETTVADGRCRFRAVRGGVEVWSSNATCAKDVRVGGILAYPNRLYVDLYEDGMASVDLRDGDTHRFDYSFRPFNSDTLRATSVGPDVIVRQHRTSFTGVDPATGKRLWKRSFDKRFGNVLDPDVPVYPGAKAIDGSVSIINGHKGFWRWAAIGRDKSSELQTFLDPRTGDTTAHLLQDSPYTAVGLGSDKGALVIADEQVFRLR